MQQSRGHDVRAGQQRGHSRGQVWRCFPCEDTKTHEGRFFKIKASSYQVTPHPPSQPVSPRAPPEETAEPREEGTEEAVEAAVGPMEAMEGALRPMARLLTGPMPEGDDTLHTEEAGAPPRDTCATAAVTEEQEERGGMEEEATADTDEGKEDECRLESPSTPWCWGAARDRGESKASV